MNGNDFGLELDLNYVFWVKMMKHEITSLNFRNYNWLYKFWNNCGISPIYISKCKV